MAKISIISLFVFSFLVTTASSEYSCGGEDNDNSDSTDDKRSRRDDSHNPGSAFSDSHGPGFSVMGSRGDIGLYYDRFEPYTGTSSSNSRNNSKDDRISYSTSAYTEVLDSRQWPVNRRWHERSENTLHLRVSSDESSKDDSSTSSDQDINVQELHLNQPPPNDGAGLSRRRRRDSSSKSSRPINIPWPKTSQKGKGRGR